jgi:hypothetical protein
MKKNQFDGAILLELLKVVATNLESIKSIVTRAGADDHADDIDDVLTHFMDVRERIEEEIQ